jgi:hypothetical protein
MRAPRLDHDGDQYEPEIHDEAAEFYRFGTAITKSPNISRRATQGV